MICSIITIPKVNAATSYNYGEALQKSIMFYEFQRSGVLPDNIRNNWRGDSALSDGADVGLDLTGGWYDAGDHVKFNLPMAYSQTMLAWSVYEAEDAFANSGQLDYILDEIKWVSDYLMRCHPSPNVFYYQVGNGNTDHSWWGPAEVMQMDRPSYKVDLSNPGSTVVAESAAALASSALVWKDRDPAFAASCIQHAQELYAFAENTKSDAGYTAASGFYNSHSGFYDELSWAAIWIYLATGDATYLNKAESYAAYWGTEPQSSTISFKWAHSWDDVHYGACLLLAKLTGKEIYKTATEMHLDYWSIGYNGQRITYTPKGLAWLDSWGALRYATTTAFLASVYADWDGCSQNKATIYDQFAKQQIDYALGSSGRSFVVGYGENSPEHPHHRTAQGSWADNMNTPDYHRHTLIGALVGGPAKDDSYADDVSNYVNNEVACDYNAGLVGTLAKLYDEYGGDPIPGLTAYEEVTNDEFFVAAGLNASGNNFIEIKALLNNQSGWPARVGDQLSFRYFLDLTEIIEAGYTPENITISTNYNAGAKVTGLYPWDEANNIYYVEADFTGTKIYPGGQSAFKKEVQFRISAPMNTSIWNNSNDFSYQDLSGVSSGNTVKTPYIPVYDNGVLVFGNEPGNAQNNSSISVSSVEFDKNLEKQLDIETVTTLNGNTFTGIKNGNYSLVNGTDYTISNNTVTIKKEYLASLSTGTAKLTFDFSAGVDPVMTVTIVDTTPSATISPSTASFDKHPEKQADITVAVTTNGYTLDGIKNASSTLVSGTDYQVLGNNITILGEYLKTLPNGTATLTFDFSAGLDPTLSISVTDSSIVQTGSVKLEMYNGNASSSTNGISVRYKLTNTGSTSINLSTATIRYYYTLDSEIGQNFWCDWSTIGSSNVIGTFVKMAEPKVAADYYLEIAFKESAGELNPGQSIEVQGRFSKNDWSNYNQTNDYSFSTNNSYADNNKTTIYLSGNLQSGVEP